MTLEQTLSQHVAEAVLSLYNLNIQPATIQIQKTKKEFQGNLTVVIFPFVKAARKAPQAVGQEIGEYLQQHASEVADFNAVQGFLNLTISDQYWISQLLAIEQDPTFGTFARPAQADVSENATQPLMMVEYSSPNTNKPLHLGHVRNNLLGYAIANIQEANGWKVVKTNIVNDRGIHICKSMLAWQLFGNGETPASTGKKGDHLIGDYYVRFDVEYKKQTKALMEQGLDEETAKKEAPLIKEAQAMLRRWEQGDPEIRTLWQTMNQWVYEGFDQTYKQMGVTFDKIYYESNTYLEGKAEVERGLQQGLFYQREDGSVWADLTSEGLDEKLLLRQDGTSVYMTQDIGTAKLRFQDFPIDKMVYVVGNEQEYHFKVLSILLDKLGFRFGKDLVHFSYGMVELPNGKMKSREGTVVDADDLMAQMIEDAKAVSQDKVLKLTDITEEEQNEIARIVGLGALKYFILKVDPRKNMLFNPAESIDFNGNTGPFIQYTYARIQSVLRKALSGTKPSGFVNSTGNERPASYDLTGTKPSGFVNSTETEYSHALSLADSTIALNEKETTLIQRLTEYPAAVRQAGNDFSPAVIANYLYALACDYNSFYHDCTILGECEANISALRLTLSHCVAQVIKKGMALLGIEVPNRM